MKAFFALGIFAVMCAAYPLGVVIYSLSAGYRWGVDSVKRLEAEIEEWHATRSKR